VTLAPPPADVVRALRHWFDAAPRDLPWRRDRTGYRVWVSEVMLQQTRVETVLRYYDRFLVRFPGVAALAGAEVGDVLAAWSGLGYYRRARALHRGAREVVERFGGEVPRTVEELSTIGGIGPYTAGAIASLAFGVRAPIVDGNVIRVLSRMYTIEDDPARAATSRRLWALAGALVPEADPGRFNEGLMELGATVCTPRAPRCAECPLAPFCGARTTSDPASFPRSKAAREVPTVFVSAVVTRDGDRVLLGRRSEGALFGGLWEPPMTEASDAATASRDTARFARGAREVGRVTHVLSHRRMDVAVLSGQARARARYPDVYEEVRFVREADLHQYGISTLARKVLSAASADVVPVEPSKRALPRPAADSRRRRG
jgi:A/G-specific adenine glycosylase